jgi:hypothetical protein
MNTNSEVFFAFNALLSLLVSDGPNSDDIIGVTSEEGVSISRPSQGDWLDWQSLLSDLGGLKSVNANLALQVVDLDGGGGGNAEPVSVGREHQGVNQISGIQRRQSSSLAQVPEHGNSVLASGSAQRSIRSNGDAVDVTSVSLEVVGELEGLEVPNLDELVPTSRDDQRLLNVRGESNAANPVTVSVMGDLVLELSKSVPQIDGLISGSRDDLSVISRESNRQDILSMSNESSGGDTSVKIPQSKGSIPRSGESELSIRRDGKVLDEVSVSLHSSNWDSIFRVLTSELPFDDGLVSRSRQEHIRLRLCGGQRGDPSRVSSQFSSWDKSWSSVSEVHVSNKYTKMTSCILPTKHIPGHSQIICNVSNAFYGPTYIE